MTEATGGIISYANGKKIHTFTESGTFSVTEAGNVESLVVAGGGAGGGDYGATGTAFGGGGGGGVIYTSALTVGLGNVAVTIGEGGLSVLSSGGTATDAQNSSITDGNVNFTTQTAIGGGTFAQNGGSGGGGSGGGFGTGGTGTVGQGNDGGDVTNFFTGSAGGGGAGGAGSNAPAADFTDGAGSGGDGLLSSISGTALRYGAGGGGGAWVDNAGSGGAGGGGNGGANNSGAQGGSFYGAGGGGQGGSIDAFRTGGAGHKGVVIFSYDSDFTTGRRVAQNEDLADMTASTIKGRITSTGIPQDLTAAQVAGILDTEITERAQDAIGAMVADTATIDITYTDATPELKADVRVDSINDTHIDWGTGTNQVNLDDVPDGSTYVKITATNHTDLTDGGDTTLHAHGIYGLLSGTLAQFAATTSLELKNLISDETGSGALVFANTPTLISPVISNFFWANHTHAASGVTGGTLASATGLPLTTGVTGILPAANGGTGINNSTRTLTISTNAGTIDFSAAASTLTVPATGTAALLATANNFSAVQTVSNTTEVTGGGTTASPYLTDTGSLLVSGGVNIKKILMVGTNGNDAFQVFNSGGGKVGDMCWAKDGVLVWLLRADGTAMSGANAGADFLMQARADDGSNIGNVFSVTRSTRLVNFSVTTDSTSSTTGAVIFGGGVGIAKSVSINGNVGIGQAASVSAGLFLLRTATDTSGAMYGLNGGVFSNPASASSTSVIGAQVTARTNVANAQNHTGIIAGGLFTAYHRGSGTASNLTGGRFSITNDGGGTVTDAITLSVLSATNSSGTITNNYGILIGNQSVGGTLNYAIYTGTGLVRFGDSVSTTGNLSVDGNTTLGNASTDTITHTGRAIFRTAASDPKHATAGSRPAGSVGEIVYYTGKMYFCTNAATPTWELITSA